LSSLKKNQKRSQKKPKIQRISKSHKRLKNPSRQTILKYLESPKKLLNQLRRQNQSNKLNLSKRKSQSPLPKHKRKTQKSQFRKVHAQKA